MGLGKSLKKVTKGLTSIATGGLSNILGSGGSSGPANPYGAPNLDFLKDMSLFDYLKKPIADKANPLGPTDQYFQDYLGAIEAPSSTDAVRSEVEGDLMRQLLEGIDTDTKGDVGSLKLDFADRGLAGPGQISEMEATGLAQTYGDASKRKAGVRSQYALSELDRLTKREDAKRGAYQTRYGMGSDLYSQLLDLENARELGYADILNARDTTRATGQAGLYNAAADRQQAGKKNPIWEDILRGTRLSLPIPIG